MVTERQCFYAKKVSRREKGCQNEAKWRVVLGKGFTIDVCDEHVEAYRGMGYTILELRTVEV